MFWCWSCFYSLKCFLSFIVLMSVCLFCLCLRVVSLLCLICLCPPLSPPCYFPSPPYCPSVGPRVGRLGNWAYFTTHALLSPPSHFPHPASHSNKPQPLTPTCLDTDFGRGKGNGAGRGWGMFVCVYI